MTKETYYMRKEQKKCVQCGAPADDGIYCDACRVAREDNEDQREISKRYKERYNNNALDQMAKEAHDKHISYGKLQSIETIERRKK